MILKFSLLNLVLVIAVIALSIALFCENVFDQATEVNRHKRLINGAIHATHSDRTIKLADYYFEAPEQFPSLLIEKLSWDILFLEKNQGDVDLALQANKSDLDAYSLARDALGLLKCKDSIQFFEKVKKLDGFDGNEDIFPEIYDPSSSEYKDLKEFIERSFSRPRQRNADK